MSFALLFLNAIPIQTRITYKQNVETHISYSKTRNSYLTVQQYLGISNYIISQEI